MRHFWVECAALNDDRLELQVYFNISPAWWAAQPRITAKSGWVAFDAHRSADVRAMLQIAACELGLRVMVKLRGSDWAV